MAFFFNRNRPPGEKPPSYVFTQVGIDLEFAQSKFGKIVTGGINIKTDPKVFSLASKAIADEQIRAYLRCLAIRRDKYTPEQAAYFDGISNFMQTVPTAEQFIEWQKDNPFPIPESDNNRKTKYYKLYGKVHQAGDERQGISPATVHLDLTVTRSQSTTRDGDFVFEISQEDEGKAAKIWAEAQGYKKSSLETIILKEPFDKINIPLNPEGESTEIFPSPSKGEFTIYYFNRHAQEADSIKSVLKSKNFKVHREEIDESEIMLYDSYKRTVLYYTPIDKKIADEVKLILQSQGITIMLQYTQSLQTGKIIIWIFDHLC